MSLWNIFLLKFLWDSHNAHQAWLNKRPSSTLGALIIIPFLLLEFALRLVILGPLCLLCISLIWFLIAPTSFKAFTDWLGDRETEEAIVSNGSQGTGASIVSSPPDRNASVASSTPHIDQLERMYGAGTGFDYVSEVWGTQLPLITASDARRIIIDRALNDADYIAVLPRDDTPGRSVLVDKQGTPILAIHRESGFAASRREPVTPIQLQSGTSTEASYTGSDKSTVSGNTTGPPAGLPENVSIVIRKWVDTVNNRDIQGHSALYAENVDQFYTKRDLTHRDIDRELAAMYSRYAEISVSQLSNWSWDQIQPDVIRVTFDKHFEGILGGATLLRTKREGNVRSQLLLRSFEGSWKIISESDPKVYSVSH